MEPISIHIAVLVIAERRAVSELPIMKIVTQRASDAGHRIVAQTIVKDSEVAIRDQLKKWIAEPDIDVIIVTGEAESANAVAAFRPLVTEMIPGFSDLFRWLAFQEIGASAMTSNAEAAQCDTTYVFVLPAAIGAVGAAMDKLILPQLDPNTTPRNLVSSMPRLQQDATKADAIPGAIDVRKEGTARNAGLPAKLPATPNPTRQKPRTANLISRKQDDPPTKPIDVAKLERQLALSQNQNDAPTRQLDLNQNDAPTRQLDLKKMISRVPPGADETLDVDDSDIREDTGSTAAAPPQRAPAPWEPRQQPAAWTPKGSQSLPVTSRTKSGPPVPAVTPSRTKPAPGSSPETQLPAAASMISLPSTSKPANARSSASQPVVARTTTPHSSSAPIPSVAKPASKPTPAPTLPAAVAKSPPPAAAPAAPPPAAPVAKSPPPAPAAAPVAKSPPPEAKAPPPAAAEPAPAPAEEEEEWPVPAKAEEEQWPVPPRAEDEEAWPVPKAEDEEEWPTAPKAEEAEEWPAPPAAEAAPQQVEPAPEHEPAAKAEPALKKAARPAAPPPQAVGAVKMTPFEDASFEYPTLRPTGSRVFLWLLALAVAAGAGFAIVVYVVPRFFPAEMGTTAPPPVASTEDSTAAPVTPTEPVAAAAIDAAVAEVVEPKSGVEPKPGVEPSVAPKPEVGKPGGTTSTTSTKPPPTPNTGSAAKPGKGKDPAAGSGAEAEPTPPASDECDETACVSENYARPCCEKYRPTEAEFKQFPEKLDKTMVKTSIERVKPKVIACGEASGVQGTVKLSITVSPDGSVRESTVDEAPDADLGDCVASAIRKAQFPKTQNGASFKYPFSF